MISLLRWIWGGVKGIAKRLWSLFGVLWDLLSHAITWIIGGVVYVAHEIAQWITDALASAFSMLSPGGYEPTGLDNLPALAQYVLLNWLALDVAIEALLWFFAIWVSAKLARLAMVPIRAALDLL